LRPIYETKTDVANERQIADQLERAWSCSLMKLSKPLSNVDMVAVRDGRVVALVEIKRRKYTSGQIQAWGGYMISLDKIKEGLAYSRAAGLPFILAVGLADGTFTIRVDDATPDVVRIGGRSDRGDAKDIEVVVLYDMQRFRRIQGHDNERRPDLSGGAVGTGA